MEDVNFIRWLYGWSVAHSCDLCYSTTGSYYVGVMPLQIVCRSNTIMVDQENVSFAPILMVQQVYPWSKAYTLQAPHFCQFFNLTFCMENASGVGPLATAMATCDPLETAMADAVAAPAPGKAWRGSCYLGNRFFFRKYAGWDQ